MKLYDVSLLATFAAFLQSGQASSGFEHPQLSEKHAEELLSHGGSCCEALSHVLQDRVSFPGEVAYNKSISSYWSLQAASVRPTCVFAPKTAEEVSLAVYVLRIGAKNCPEECKFAVRSAGHTPFASSANIRDGVTIDLQGLNQVSISTDKKFVTIGAGNRWGNVYSHLASQGLATSGGRVSTVGVGGLVLGGGVSYFSAQKGFVCDTVKRFEVVLPSGQIVNSTQSSYHDLWLALKGGSNNFGIVTAIEQDAFEQGDFWGGSIGGDESTFPAQFAAFEAFTGSPDYDPNAALINSYTYIVPTNSWLAVNAIEYTKPEAYPPFFKNITSIPQTFNTMKISNLTDFATEMAVNTPPGHYDLFATGTFGNSAKMQAAIFEIANATVHDGVKDVAGLVFSLSFQPEPTIITTKAASKGGNSLGLDDSEGNVFNLLLTATWSSAADNDLMNKAAKRLFSESEAKAKELGFYKKYLYLNYAAEWQDPIDGYGPKVKARLQSVSRKYDPSGIFQKQVPGGFKLFK